MPKSRVMGLRWVLAPAAAFVAAAACCPPAGAVVGGSETTISQAPYQVAIYVDSGPSIRYICGGTIRDSTHVITAAHCVFNSQASGAGEAVAPGKVTVLAGTAELSGGTPRNVTNVSFLPAFDAGTLAYDAALLTTETLPLGGSSPRAVRHVQDPGSWAPLAVVGQLARVTGWGWTATSAPGDRVQDKLQAVSVPMVRDDTCRAAYPDGFASSVMLCAGAADKDACYGDSGGPLIMPASQPASDETLVGIVSFGPEGGCGLAEAPGVYTEVGAPEVHSFVVGAPGEPPRTTSPPSVAGDLAVGGTVSCSTGSWNGSPTAFVYQFVRDPQSNGTSAGALTPLGAASTYTIASSDAGHTLGCIVKATNADGWAVARSGASGAIPLPPGTTAPSTTLPSTAPAQASQDVIAPVARITKTTCTATRCTLSVTVTDAGFSAGIKTVQSSVRSTYRTRCKRQGSSKTYACTKHRTIKPSVAALTATRFKVVASKLPYGTQRFTLVAIDKAGHRQALPTTKTVTTKKPKKRR
jgi:hypothetical protein